MISELKAGDDFKGDVKIMRKVKPGPTILVITDIAGSIDAVTKDTPFDVGDIVYLEGKVSERQGKLQIEIQSIRKSDHDFTHMLEELAKPEDRPLSIDSERLSKLRPKFMKAAQLIRKAVLQHQPILIRHHADADGIMSGLAIEKACALLMEQIGINPTHNLYRSPSKAPFYEVADVFKDIAFTKKVLENHNQEKPLVLVLDNGSTPEDVFAHKTLKSMGFDVIVIDHHNPVELENGKTAVCPYLLYHINPYIDGMDSKTSAGMLCYEVARLVHASFDLPLMPAIAGISDRCDIPETEAYIKNTGKSHVELQDMGTAIDYIAYNLRFDSGVGVYEEVFKNDAMVKMILEKVKEGEETQLQSTLPYLRTQEINGVLLSFIDLEKYTLRFTYPTPGKVLGRIHDRISKDKGIPVLTIGLLSDMAIIRATEPVLPVAEIIESIQKAMPEANADGGGHEVAGTLKFVQAHQAAIVEHIKRLLRERDTSPKEE